MPSYDYAANIGKMDTDALLEQFGIKAGDSTWAEGSTTGIKGNPVLGEGYLDEKDYDRLKNSDAVWEAYAAQHGQEAMEAKREGNPDGLSINALDSTLDKMSASEKADLDPEEEADPPIEHSPEVADAKKRSEEWIRKASDGTFSNEVFGASNDLAKGITKGEVVPTSPSGISSQGFLKKYKLDLGDAIKADINSKVYKAGIAKPQNNDESNAEGF